MMRNGLWSNRSTVIRQFAVFILVGLAQLCLDSLLFILATAVGMEVPIANILGRLSGAVLGFWLNGLITFPDSGSTDGAGAQAVRLRAVRFAVFWLGATTFSTIVVRLVESTWGLHSAWLAKPVVEAVLAVVSFFVSKHWIYR